MLRTTEPPLRLTSHARIQKGDTDLKWTELVAMSMFTQLCSPLFRGRAVTIQ